jgi:two-component system, LytTR family, sensor kinase
MTQKSRLNFKVRIIIMIVLFYLFFMVTYYAALTIASYEWSQDKYLFSFKKLIPEFIDYCLKFLITVPIWYLIFKKCSHKSLSFRLFIHLFTLPIFVLLWQRIFYFILESFGYGHLSGYGQAWDIYIPGLFYFIQFGVLHAYEYYKDNQEQQKIQSELREASLRNELSALKSQLNPHFLYNVFNTINASVPKELENTRKMIATLADMFRYQLQASQSEFVMISEEINFVKQYLDLEKARFENRLKITIHIEDHILEEKITPMIIQPLVENAVKHGLSSLIEGGEIVIKINKINDNLHFTIADTGIGIEDKAAVFGKGIGLTNTKLILEKVHNSTLKLSDNLPKGLKIEFKIPAK